MTDLGTKRKSRRIARPIKVEPIKAPTPIKVPEREPVKV